MPDVIHDNKSVASIVMAIGVGGGGGNAVNHLYKYGDKDVSFMLCNTDRQALVNSPIPDKYKIQLGKDGLGAGNEASSGRKLAEEAVDAIKEALVSSGIRMAFVVAGMGGGTGTGAAPIVAKTAKELGILTIGVVTIPFEEEGRHRIEQAIAGVDELSKNVDSLIIINNAHIVEMYGDLPMSQAYFQSNEIIAKAVKSISDIINKHFLVNVDFADVCKVMRDSGVALMGTGRAVGDNRAIIATEEALTSPLLHNQDIKGAKNVLVCLISSEENEIKMSDAYKVPKYIQERTKTMNTTDVIWGAGYDNSLDDQIQVIVIATGFNVQNIPAMKEYYSKTLGYDPVKENEDNSQPKTKRINLDFEGEGTSDQNGYNKVQLDSSESERRIQFDEDKQDDYSGNYVSQIDDEPYISSLSKSGHDNYSNGKDTGAKTIMFEDQNETNEIGEGIPSEPVVYPQSLENQDPVNPIFEPGYSDDPELPKEKPEKAGSQKKTNIIDNARKKAKNFFSDMFVSKEDDESL